MSDYTCIELERHDDGVRVLHLNRPPVNALGRDLVGDLLHAEKALLDDADARCLIVRSTSKHFCAGADLKERKGMSEEEVKAFVPKLGEACHGLARLPFPTIAALRGAAAGGGCELALGCDFRIASEDAKIGLRETALAIIPGAGGTQRLPRMIGLARAKRWIFTARMHGADVALRDGVVDQVVAADELDDACLAMAREIAANGPVAIRLAKKAVEQGADMALPDALRFEWDCYQGVLQTEDRVEALKAFAEKRTPEFKGR